MDKGVPGQSYMLAGPEHSLAEAVRLAVQIGDGRKPLVVPGGLVRGLGRVSGAIGRVLGRGFRLMIKPSPPGRQKRPAPTDRAADLAASPA